jgi:hypothetical protein
MAYSHRNIAEEQKEACQKTQQITAMCEHLSITLDPVDWQNAGMRAWVTVNTIKIADLLDLSQQDHASLLRRVQIKLLEHAALQTLRARPGLKVVIWSPVDVVPPQAFLSLWVLTMETDERIAIAEYLRNGQRVYEPYELDVDDGQQLATLFGALHTGEYQLGDTVTIGERERKCTGMIVYILPPGKALASHKGYHRIWGKAYTNDISPRYLIDCHDGFPHVANQSQVIGEIADGIRTTHW